MLLLLFVCLFVCLFVHFALSTPLLPGYFLISCLVKFPYLCSSKTLGFLETLSRYCCHLWLMPVPLLC